MSDTTRCLFPKGNLDGQCVECPVDTLYEYIRSIQYKKQWYYSRTVTIDNSYHRCVKMCSKINPVIGSQRICTSSCPTNKIQKGDILFCKDDNINDGFCENKQCLSAELRCYFMQCFNECPDFTVSYNNSCVIDCFEDKPFIFLKRCVKNCPANHVLEDGVCRKSCSIGKYLYNKTCVQDCPATQQYVNEQKCVTGCPVQKKKQGQFCVNTCSNKYYQDGNNCVNECPESRRFVDETNCVRRCPVEKLIQEMRCVHNCSDSFFFDGNKCVKKCPKSHQYINERHCVEKCPVQKYIQDLFCVHQCFESYFLDGQLCKKECPANLFVHERQCVKSCPETTLTENHMCVLKCSYQLFQTKHYCLSECPSGYFINGSSNVCVEHCNGVKYFNNNVAFCMQDCPNDTANVNSTCVTSCPKSHPFFFLQRCLIECPTHSKFFSKRIGPDNTVKYVCVDRCSKYVSLLSKMCVDACSFNEVLFRRICQKSCPQSDPYRLHLPETSRNKLKIKSSFNIIRPINAFTVCSQKCPSTFVKENMDCFPECPHSERSMVYNSSCFKTCPETDPYILKKGNQNICTYKCPKLRFEKQCVTRCPKSTMSMVNNECINVNCSEIGKFEDGKLCVDKCEIVQYENRCYKTCPKGVQYAFNGTCQKSCPIYATMSYEQYYGRYTLTVCLSDCPKDTFIFDNHCVSKCPSVKRLPLNGTCTACIDVGKYDDGSKCVDFCPYLHYNSQCLESCPKELKVFNGTCVSICPFDAPLESYITNDYNSLSDLHCVASCEKGYYQFDNRCVYFCDNNYYYFNGSCVEICPKTAPYMSEVKSIDRSMVQCFHQCKKTQFSMDFTCFDKCPDGYLGYKQLCIRKCPSDSSYIYNNLCVKGCKTLRGGMNCFDKCPKGTLHLDKTCVRTCPSIKPYAFKDKCVRDCQRYVIKKKCYEQCPSGLNGYKNKCLVNCPREARYSYKWECLPRCPNKTFYIYSTCLDKCPKGKFQFERTCLFKCPSRNPYVFNNECVSICNGYLDGKFCRMKCPKRKFSYKRKCITKCPMQNKFVNGQECVESCPFAHDAHFNCLKACPKKSHRYGKTCKTGCPSHVPFVGLFDETCSEKCGFYELATEDYKCIIKSDCSGFIDGIWCRSMCLNNTYILISGRDKLCKSLLPVYIAIPVLSVCVFPSVVFSIRVLCHCCSMPKVGLMLV